MEGHYGAWLVAGPISSRQAKKLDIAASRPREGVRVGAGSTALYRLLAGRSALDLGRRVSARPGDVAVVGAVLDVKRAVDVWLMISVDGRHSVLLDGQLIGRREQAHLRHQSWDLVPLRLEPGSRRLVLQIEHPGKHWALDLRLLDRSDLLPPTDVVFRLPGTTSADQKRLLKSMSEVRLRPGLSATGQSPELVVAFPRGAPMDAELSLSVTLSGVGKTRKLALGAMDRGPRGVPIYRARLPRIPQGELPDRARLRARPELDGAKLSPSSVLLAAASGRALKAAIDLQAELAASDHPTLADSSVISASLEYLVAELATAASDSRSRRLAARIQSLVRLVREGKDPLLSKPGVVELARRSRLDGRPQPFRLHLPSALFAAEKPGQRWPLVLALHGYNGSPKGIMDAFLDSRLGGPRVPGIVLAPNAHGNAFYRDAGEQAVVDALDWAQRVLPVDPLRVSVTGVSMGGTGAAYLGLRYADRFSAASPLCGYHSYFIRRDTSRRPIRPWERARMHHWSSSSWAENGRNLPMFVAQGTQDHPLENSRVLVRRYRELGYRVSDDWPDTGHAVWEKTWDGARMWPWLSAKRRDPSPRAVTVRTNALRYARQAWVEITALETPGAMAQVDAKLGDGGVVVRSRGVTGFRLDRFRAGLGSAASVSVLVDGTALSFAPAEVIELKRGSALDGGILAWRKGAAESRGKRAGREGPIRDVFQGPMTVIYGTRRASSARANLELARGFAHRPHGADLQYRVVADREAVDSSRLAGQNLLLVGGAADNQMTARLAAELPATLDGTALRFGEHRFSGPGVGAFYVFPHPDKTPDGEPRYVLVLIATDLSGLYRVRSLPRLLPDFVIFDAKLGPATGQQVLGAGKVLGAGFFDWDWSVPKEITDPELDRSSR